MKKYVWQGFGKKSAVEESSEKYQFETRPGGWVVATSPGGKRQRLFVGQKQGKWTASLGGQLWYGEFKPVARGEGAGTGASEADLVAQFPGKVRKLLVKVGEKVTEGQPLLLVEAMKMEFVIKCPFAAQVAKILVEEGQQISPGTRFVDLTR